jgi:hypothetical protein
VANRQAEALVTERASSRGEVRQYWGSGSVLAESRSREQRLLASGWGKVAVGHKCLVAEPAESFLAEGDATQVI